LIIIILSFYHLILWNVEIKPLPQFGYHFNPEFIKGIFMRDNVSYLILDVNKVFDIVELNAVAEQLQTSNNEINS